MSREQSVSALAHYLSASEVICGDRIITTVFSADTLRPVPEKRYAAQLAASEIQRVFKYCNIPFIYPIPNVLCLSVTSRRIASKTREKAQISQVFHAKLSILIDR